MGSLEAVRPASRVAVPTAELAEVPVPTKRVRRRTDAVVVPVIPLGRPARLVGRDGEVVPAVGPVGRLPVAPTTAAAAVAIEQLQRAGPRVGLAQKPALRAPVAHVVAGAVPSGRVLGAGEVLPRRLHVLQAQLLRPVVVVEGQGLGPALREVVPQGRAPGPTTSGVPTPVLPPRRASIPTADGRRPVGQEGLAPLGPPQVAGLPVTKHVLGVTAQTAGVRTDDAVRVTARVRALATLPVLRLAVPRLADGRAAGRARTHPGRPARPVLRTPEAAEAAPARMVAGQGPSTGLQGVPCACPGLLAALLAPCRLPALPSVAATAVAAWPVDVALPATVVGGPLAARTHSY